MRKYLQPKQTHYFLTKAFGGSLLLGIVLLIIGLITGIFVSDADSIQGLAGKIIYTHVPAAWMALATFCTLGCFSLIALVWRISIISISTLSLARLSVLFSGLTLITGMIWAKPMWGTWWVWDARLTSMFFQFLLSLGILFMHPDYNLAEPQRRNAHIFSVIGLVNLPIIKGSVIWWNTLHQGSTVSLGKSWSIELSMAYPLFFIFAGYILLTIAIVSLDIRETLMRGHIYALQYRHLPTI